MILRKRVIEDVTQNYMRYYLSLRDNVSISDLTQEYNDKKIYEALAQSEAFEILEQAGSLDQRLGREFDGLELSGGQWQRLAVARGFFRNQGIIVLDEPTSAFDPNIENDFLNCLLELSGDKTTLIISHRMHLCKKMDRIIVMDKGEIVEMGVHKYLINRDGIYKKLYKAQQKWY